MSKDDKNDALDSVSEPRVYELGFLIAPSLTDEKLTDAVDVLRAAIDTAGGSIIAEGAPALRDLAYEMSKMIANKRSSYTSAHFGWLKFEATSDVPDKMKLELDANNDLIRYIIVKTVREDTMVSVPSTRPFEPSAGQELAMADSGKERKVEKRVPEEKVEISEEEIDEEIDKLLDEDDKIEEKKED